MEICVNTFKELLMDFILDPVAETGLKEPKCINHKVETENEYLNN